MDNPLLFLIVALAVVAAFIMMKRLGMISVAEAQRLIGEGALIIDVRSEREFKSDPLPQTINIPVDQIKERIAAVARDKNQPVLLHCLSGGRSAMARSVLRRMGYAQAHNLGSLHRARQILNRR